MTTDSITKAAQDQILDAITTTQTAIVEGVKTWSSSFADTVPALPAIPGLDKLPKPAETVALGFAFAERLLTSQREFAEKLLVAAQPKTAATKPAAAKA